MLAPKPCIVMLGYLFWSISTQYNIGNETTDTAYSCNSSNFLALASCAANALLLETYMSEGIVADLCGVLFCKSPARWKVS